MHIPSYISNSQALSVIPFLKGAHCRALSEWTDSHRGWLLTTTKAVTAATINSSLLVSLVFWSLLSSNIARQPDLNEKLMLILGHSLNAALVIAEILLVWIQPSWKDVWAPILTTFLYVCYVWTLHYADGWFWPYPLFPLFMDPVQGPLWLTVVALLLGSLVIAVIHSGLFMGLAALRNVLWKKKTTQRPVPIPFAAP